MTTTIDLESPTIRALRELITLGCRILAKLELVDYLGHVSARVPGTDAERTTGLPSFGAPVARSSAHRR